MKHILITGGAGFIGSHTCLDLIEKGYKVTIVDSLINSSKNTIQNIKSLIVPLKKNLLSFHKLDIRNEKDLSFIFAKAHKENIPFEAVIHFAGLKSVNESKFIPLEYWDNNVYGTINLLKVMQKNGCFNMVFSSSATVYAETKTGCFSEDSELGPVNPYGQTKLTIEKILHDVSISMKNKWKITCLRYFNPVGAHLSGKLGEDPKGIPNNLLPFLSQVAIGKINMLKIFGNDWPTNDGTGVRDYIHVMDLAEAHSYALQHLFDNDLKFLTLNLGTGRGTSVLELLKCFEEINNVKIPFEFVKRRLGDVPIAVANNEKARRILNWVPKRDLKKACVDSWNWQINNMKTKK